MLIGCTNLKSLRIATYTCCLEPNQERLLIHLAMGIKFVSCSCTIRLCISAYVERDKLF